MNTITLTIPADWLEGETPSQDELRQALKIGLAQLRRQQQARPESAEVVIQALLKTGRVSHLTTGGSDDMTTAERQPPPTLPGPLVSDILIAQRRGEL